MPRRNKKLAIRAKPKKARVPRSLSTDNVEAYRRLLMDPCNAPFAPVPGLGPGSGLYMRLRSYVALDQVVASDYLSFAFAWNPAINLHRKMIATSESTALNNASAPAFTGGIFNGSGGPGLAQSYRVVAACAKFIPSGPISSRMGLIGCGFVPDKVLGSGTDTINSVFTLCPSVAANGADSCEVKWFPSDPADLEFRDQDVTYNADTGTIIIAGIGVDSVNATTSVVRGKIELTAVVEWIPNLGQSIAAPIIPPPKYTLQDALRGLGDIGLAAVSRYGPGVARMAMNYMATRAAPTMGMLTG